MSRKDYHATLKKELTTIRLSRNTQGSSGRSLQSTFYGRSWTQDFEGVFRSILNYKGDVSSFDPALLKAYDEVIPEIERALGD